jgi:hypothetical protein
MALQRVFVAIGTILDVRRRDAVASAAPTALRRDFERAPSPDGTGLNVWRAGPAL